MKNRQCFHASFCWLKFVNSSSETRNSKVQQMLCFPRCSVWFVVLGTFSVFGNEGYQQFVYRQQLVPTAMNNEQLVGQIQV